MPKYIKSTDFIPVDDHHDGALVPERVTCTDFCLLPSGALGSSTHHVLLQPQAHICDVPPSATTVADRPTGSLVQLVDCLEEMVLVNPVNTAHADDNTNTGKKTKRPSYTPLPEWLAEREAFLNESLRLEGLAGQDINSCSLCKGGGAYYRCTQCCGADLFCQPCIVQDHLRNPLHLIEMWTSGSFFQRIALKDLGLSIQLGHSIGESCRNPKPANTNGFIVIDIYGINEVNVLFCNCEASLPQYVQILRYGWHPASVDRPKTAATNSVLKFFQLLTFESKTSQFEFYNTLARFSDNTGINTPKDRYQAFVVMIREFRNLKSLKRGARGHKPGGVSGTRPGELAVLCPACPHPGINMTPGWETSPSELQFLHCLFLAIDANFRLKRRNVSSEERDPGLGEGWSYFVPQADYKEHLEKFNEVIKQPRSTCSEYKAVNDERAAKGYAATGVATIDCARHDMKRPLAVGDMFKGERYVYTDYMFISSLRNSQHQQIVVSYDISCQWSRHLAERLETYGNPLHFSDEGTTIRFLVPKFHLPSHIISCQTKYSFNFAPYVGRTDGEAPERGWARINPVATSTMEMGPGSRRDVLNDHFADCNWKKTITLAYALYTKLVNARQQAGDYTFLHNQFVLGLREDAVKEWEAKLTDWKNDPSKPNPFEKQSSCITEHSIRERMATEETSRDKKKPTFTLHESVSGSKLIVMGLDLEDQQHQLTLLEDDSSRPAEAQARINVLHRKIQSWITIQHLYIPTLYSVRQADDSLTSPDDSEPAPTSIKLYLPSEILRSPKRRLIDCDRRLVSVEYELRRAQANDALGELRNSIRLRTYVYQDKDRFQRGQWRNTRSRGILSRLEKKVTAAARKYRAARIAISSLAPELRQANWEKEFPPLHDQDLRGFHDDDLPPHMRAHPVMNMQQKKDFWKSKNKQNKKKELSWIWKQAGAHEKVGDDCAFHKDLRIEFCRSKARAERWKEEVSLLQEEMNRVKAFFLYRSKEWQELGEGDSPSLSHLNLESATLEGF